MHNSPESAQHACAHTRPQKMHICQLRGACMSVSERVCVRVCCARTAHVRQTHTRIRFTIVRLLSSSVLLCSPHKHTHACTHTSVQCGKCYAENADKGVYITHVSDALLSTVWGAQLAHSLSVASVANCAPKFPILYYGFTVLTRYACVSENKAPLTRARACVSLCMCVIYIFMW